MSQKAEVPFNFSLFVSKERRLKLHLTKLLQCHTSLSTFASAGTRLKAKVLPWEVIQYRH
jgi:hypothetical protein